MATRERREEYSSSNVVRTLHPSRPLSPANNSAVQLDNGLDDLLDDLQTTVTRTAQHLNNSTKSRDVQYLSPSNTTTVVKERSVSPAGLDGNKTYKSASYEYSSSSRSGGGGTLNPQQYNSTNVNQLDSLLDDLKQERDNSLDREKNFLNVGIDDGLLEPNTRLYKTTRTVTKTGVPKQGVNRELHFDSPSLVQQTLSTHDSRSRQRSRSPNYQKHIESQITRDVTYESDPVPDKVISSSQRSYNYSKTSDHQKRVIPYTTDIVEVETTDLPAELKNVPLSSDILPGPGTKVTTTIKTFTYEIPGDTKIPTNQNFSYKNEFYNSSNASTTNQIYPERDIPPPGGNQTIIYKNESHNTLNRHDGYPGYPNGGPPTHPDPDINQTYIYKKETNETTNNVYPPHGRPQRTTSPPPVNSTLIYQHDVSNTNRNIHHPPPGGVQVYPYEPSNLPPHPTHPGAKQTYLFKKETSNTTNTVYGPPGGGHPPHDRYVAGPGPDYSGPPYGQPTEPNTTMYKYSSTSSHTTNVHGQPRDREPLLAPFPVDGISPSQVDGQPPKHLNELLTTLGDNGVNGRIDDEPYTPRKEINTALATHKPVAIVDPKVPTKNIAGPPVYYPPGQEMFAKNEQSSAAWRAQGGYAKASGKYEYEAESKSKSSSKSGAAVVPVCLPLCCAMPCSIM